MKRRVEIQDRNKYVSENSKSDSKSDFYDRWYAKFGTPQNHTLPGDEFMSRLKEMVDFE